MDPVNVMSPYWLNDSCSPFLAPNGTCTLGNLASYAINVSDAATVAAGIKFAQKKNIRLTIKNTGHDISGRSAGEGSLALWTHHLKDLSFVNYTSPYYTGPAARISAGVENFEVYQAASQHGLRVVGGSCPTVGISGGSVQGGGHGPLGATYGLSADNTLEFEVVTVDGKHLTASPSQNADLYWALSGGGPGNFAVVMSTTVKAHIDGPLAGAGFSFLNTNADAFWSAVAAWIKHLLVLDQITGLYTLWAFSNEEFLLEYATLPGGDTADMLAALDPFFQELETLNVTLTSNESNVHSTFEEHYTAWATQTYDTNNSVGGRLIQRSAVQDRLPELVATLRGIVSDSSLPGALISGIANNVTHARIGNQPDSNAVLPAWRDSLFHTTIGVPLAENAPWDHMRKVEAQLNQWQDQLRALTPGGGTYMNEATFDNPNWKSDYFGENYDRLRAIKAKYDPEGTLWANAAVGSDDTWSVAEDGRLCRVD